MLWMPASKVKFGSSISPVAFGERTDLDAAETLTSIRHPAKAEAICLLTVVHHVDEVFLLEPDDVLGGLPDLAGQPGTRRLARAETLPRE